MVAPMAAASSPGGGPDRDGFTPSAQPVEREGRDDPTTHNDHQDEHGIDRQQQTGAGGVLRPPEHLGVEQSIGGEQDREDDQERQIAKASRTDQRRRQCEREPRKESEIDRRSRLRKKPPRAHRDAAGEPQRDEQRERTAGVALPACPTGHCSQQKPGNCRRHKTEHHLVRVPQLRRQPGWRRSPRRVHRQPAAHGDDGVAAGREEERPKAIGKDRGKRGFRKIEDQSAFQGASRHRCAHSGSKNKASFKPSGDAVHPRPEEPRGLAALIAPAG